MNKLITGLHNKLMTALNEDVEAFFKERPFLDGGELVITPLPEKLQTDMEVTETARVLKEVVDATIPPVEPPKQLDFHT